MKLPLIRLPVPESELLPVPALKAMSLASVAVIPPIALFELLLSMSTPLRSPGPAIVPVMSVPR